MSDSNPRSALAVLVGCSVILFIGFGVRSGFGLFLQPISGEFGWGREVFSFAMALQNLVWGLLGPFAGGVADRWGNGRVVAFCGLMYVIGLVAMAFASTPLGLQIGAGFFIGLALSGTTFSTLLAVIGRVTAPEQRSTALGIATALGSFGQFAVLPVTQAMLSNFGWQNALLGLAAVASLMIPLAWFARGRSPVQAGSQQSLGESLREALGEKGFHLIFWGYFTCGFHIALMTIHLPSFVVDQGLTPEQGMTALALIGLFNVLGAFAAGWLGGRHSKKFLLSSIYSLRAASVLLLIAFPLTPLTLYFCAGMIGLLWLSTVPLTNGLVGHIFGLRYAATLTAIVFVGHQVGGFIGAWLGGWLFDQTGSYISVLAIAAGFAVFAAIVNLPVNETPLAERKAAPAAA